MLRNGTLIFIAVLMATVFTCKSTPADPVKIWHLNFHRGIKIGDADPFNPDDPREWKCALPRAIVIKEDVGEPEVFWYLLYTIQNKDDEDHSIFINVSGVSDKANATGFGIAHEGGGSRNSKESAIYNDLPNDDVKEAIEKRLLLEMRLKFELWGWEDVCQPKKLDGKAGVKADGRADAFAMPQIKAKKWHRCIAIFNRMDSEADIIKIYFQGLTNDFQVTNHLQDPSLEETERLMTTRVFELTFERKGDEFKTVDDKITYKGHQWVKWVKKLRLDLKHNETFPNNP